MDLDREMHQHTEISRTASKNGVEQLGVSSLGNFFEVPLVVYYLERENVVSEQAKTAAQLAIPTAGRGPQGEHRCTVRGTRIACAS
jgi:hypothetical protein